MSFLTFLSESSKCGSFGCVDWNEDFLAWEKLGIGRMLVFMGLEGILFYLLIALTELKVFQIARYSLSRVWRKVAVKPREGEYHIFLECV